MRVIVIVASILFLLLAACAPVAPPETTTPLASPAPTPWPYSLTDERAVTAGICFESANDAAGRVFVLRSESDLTWLFDSSDSSGLCRRPSPRGAFDFGGVNGAPARALAGVWSRGIGCTADHVIEAVDVDEAARTFTVRARLVIGGDCPYELVRPFWIGITGYNEYDIRLSVE
jgi:hypothetical protein